MLATAIIASRAFAQRAAWPDKPLKIVIPFAAGGTADVVARLLATALTERLGQPVVVEAKAGANGIIGADSVAKAAPDGNTLLLHSSAHAINASLYKKLPFDTERGFVPVAPVVAPGVFVIVVHPSLPVRNLREFVEYARAKPDAVSYGSAGIGNGLHLAGEMLGQMAGVKLLHCRVPQRCRSTPVASRSARERRKCPSRWRLHSCCAWAMWSTLCETWTPANSGIRTCWA